MRKSIRKSFGKWGLLPLLAGVPAVLVGFSVKSYSVKSYFVAFGALCLLVSAQPAMAGTFVETDVKPGSNPNCVNPRSGGVISVAYFGSATFDPADIDQTTLEWGGVSPLRCAFEDSDQDGITDLVCKYRKRDVALPESPDDCVVVEGGGLLVDGTPFYASDHVCVTGEPVCNAGTPQ